MKWTRDLGTIKNEHIETIKQEFGDKVEVARFSDDPTCRKIRAAWTDPNNAPDVDKIWSRLVELNCPLPVNTQVTLTAPEVSLILEALGFLESEGCILERQELTLESVRRKLGCPGSAGYHHYC